MKITLAIAASRAMDLYYQDYAPRDAFFNESDFKFHFATVYADMFDAIFQQFRKENKRDDGFANVELTSGWLVREQLTSEKDEVSEDWFVQTSSCLFGFGYDSFAYSLDSMRALSKCAGGKKCTLIKISRDEAKFLEVSPATSVVYYWSDAENKIRLTNFIEKVDVEYVPAVDPNDDGCLISQTIVDKVIVATLDLMFRSKNGNVVDESNDGNKNSVIGNQVNPQLTKVQQR